MYREDNHFEGPRNSGEIVEQKVEQSQESEVQRPEVNPAEVMHHIRQEISFTEAIKDDTTTELKNTRDELGLEQPDTPDHSVLSSELRLQELREREQSLTEEDTVVKNESWGNDPAAWKLERDFDALRDKYNPIYEKGADDRVFTSYEDIDKLSEEKAKLFESFVDKYPNKAQAYRVHSKELDEVLKHREFGANRDAERNRLQESINYNDITTDYRYQKIADSLRSDAAAKDIYENYTKNNLDSYTGTTNYAPWVIEKYAPEVYRDEQGNYKKEVSQESILAAFQDEYRDEYKKYLETDPNLSLSAETSEQASSQEITKIEDTPENVEDTIKKISAESSPSEQGLDVEQLKQQSYLSEDAVHELSYHEGEQLGLHQVPTDLVVGSESPSFKNWGDEYESRQGRIQETAETFRQNDPESLRKIFNPADGLRIKLKRIGGPAGDIFMAKDGTHRIAGAKMAEYPSLLAEIEDQAKLETVDTEDDYLNEDWKTLIDLGIIKGNTSNSAEGKYQLNVDSTPFPWAIMGLSNFFKVNKIYAEHYPDAFKDLSKKLKIPEQVFTDDTQVALNYFKEGRWEEYERLHPSGS